MGGAIMADVIWRDRKRIVFALPWTFTRYAVTEEKLTIDKGLLSRSEEEVRLYRILDITLRRSLWQRLFGLGTIHCNSADKSTPEFDIKNITNSAETKDRLSDLVEACRSRKRVMSREYMAGEEDDDPDDDQN
jgi:uncharacterized membrane protein YdbT with pleckstrin-like domain